MKRVIRLIVLATLGLSCSKKPMPVTGIPGPPEQPEVKVESEAPPVPVTPSGLDQAFHLTELNFKDHTGFMLYDPEKKEVLYEYNSDRYFTPGSNTKIFTLYAGLRILGDSVPALRYIERNDSLIFWGTGDPSFLYKFTFNNFRVYDFLKQAKKKLYWSTSNFHTTHFGAGWAWDDYKEYFQPEKSAFPVYGNIFSVERRGSLVTVSPNYFDQFFLVGDRKEKEEVVRELHSNNFVFHPGVRAPREKDWDVPMRVDQQLVLNLLTDTLKRKVVACKTRRPPGSNFLFSIPTDSLYAEMMKESDNFIAEQLLLMCGDVVRDSMRTETAINYSLANYLTDLPDKPIWMDGSGLSRYNLFTPRSIVRLWEKIAEVKPYEKLFPLLAAGGESGTIRKWYRGIDKPYLYGKTGTLSNNHVLSGFIITKSGRILIFAFMNNNYIAKTNEIRMNMQTILEGIRDNY